jgi:hypothetical protein
MYSFSSHSGILRQIGTPSILSIKLTVAFAIKAVTDRNILQQQNGKFAFVNIFMIKQHTDVYSMH